MRISNLKLIKVNDTCKIIADVTCKFSKEQQLWFSVKAENYDMLTTDVYDAFLVAALYPCMYYNEELIIDGKVSKKLFKNIPYIQAIIKDFRPSLHKINIKVSECTYAQKSKDLHVGTGFSGGVDSFATLMDRFINEHDKDWKIDTLFFFNVGQNGNYNNPKTQERVINRYNLSKRYPDAVGLPFIMMDTNLFAFYLPNWEFDAGVLCRATAILVFEKCLKRYYISSADSYGEMMDYGNKRMTLATFSDPYILPLLSPDGLDIILDGAQYTRSQKIQLISDDKLIGEYLNVCVNSDDDHTSGKNCSICPKCMRTLFTLEILGKLNNFSNVFNLPLYKKNAFKFKCQQVALYGKDTFATENIKLAREHNFPLPSYFISICVSYPSKIKRRIARIIKKV